MKVLLTAALALALLGTACSGGEDGTEPADPSATSSRAEGTVPAPTLPSAGSAASTPAAGIEPALIAHLAARLAVEASRVSLVSFQPMTWPDGCLGLGGSGRVCSQALVPGWLAVLRAPDGAEYRYRGTAGRFEPEP